MSRILPWSLMAVLGTLLVACAGSTGAPPTDLPGTAAQAIGVTAAATQPPVGSGRGTIAFYSDRDGSGVRQLTDTPGFDENPAWSPDGTRIVYQTDRDGNFEIYVMNADGGNQHALAVHLGNDLWPSWVSPRPISGQ